jgi:cytochrome b6-f complex iron-sulfur subunit
MAIETEPRNAGRRIITQEEAEAIAAKARPGAPPPTPRRRRLQLSRREALTYALAGSGALALATTGMVLANPDPSNDPLLSEITPKEVQDIIPGGFAYPRFKEGEFGGTFTLTKKADAYTTDQPPDLNPTGKFYVVKTDNPVPAAGGQEVAQQGLMAIYQVCTHLGCLIPFQQAENRFICPCHGSTFERNSDYVRGPASRNLDQFAIEVAADGTITVNTGQRKAGAPHG